MFNDLKLYPEDELIVCCTRTNIDNKTKEKIIYLIDEELNWDYLIYEALKHHVMPLLYFNLNSICSEKIPEDLMDKLRYYFDYNARRNSMLSRELIQILKLLKEQNIIAIPYKGPEMAAQIYGNQALRQFNDIDLFLLKMDIVKAKEILNLHGYKLKYNFNNKAEEIYLKYFHEYALFNEKKGITLDLNWRFSFLTYSFPVDMESNGDISEITAPVNFNNLRTLNIRNEFLILILCIHIAGHQWTKLYLICDIFELFQSTNKLDYQLLLNRSKDMGIKRILLINFLLIQELYNIKLPKKISDEINDDKKIKKISKKIANDMFNKNKRNIINELTLRFKTRERFQDKIKDITRALLIPMPFELEIVALPLILFPLYIFLRAKRRFFKHNPNNKFYIKIVK